MKPLGVTVIAKVRDDQERLLLIAKPGLKNFPPPPEQCYTLASYEDDPEITWRVAEAIKRHFEPPETGSIITLGLSE